MRELRWMSFVDGENLSIRASAVAIAKGIALTNGPYYMKDVFVWMPGLSATHVLAQPQKGNQLEKYAIRAHYYTSAQGDEDKLRTVRNLLRLIGFQAQVFKRNANQRQSKGVDIALTKDLLANAFHDNYDAAVLFAGDGDYVPVVEELKRMGKTVYVVFFTEPEAGLSENLRMACDKFFTLSDTFLKSWKTSGSGTGLSKPLRATNE